MGDENHIEDSLPKTQALVESILAKKKALPRSDPKIIKNQKLAAKVQLMKLKMKAQGSKAIGNQDRIYFGIKSSENKNNVADAPKLKLFKHLDGLLVTNQLDKPLNEMIKNEEVFNGDILIMEYVESNDIMQIKVTK